MKRFKKLTIYILVGVLLSSSIMVSYKKAEVVQASATLTLGTGALLMLGILGAYGIVYKGAVDSATGEYIWKGDRGAYPHEVEQAEEWFSRMYDNAVRNWCAQNGKDPDDWNGDDDGDGDDMDEIIEQPPLWETLVGSSVATDKEMMKRAIKLVGAFGVICADVVSEFKNNALDSTSNVVGNGQSITFTNANLNAPYLEIYYGNTLFGCENEKLINQFNSMYAENNVLFTSYQKNGWYFIHENKDGDNKLLITDKTNALNVSKFSNIYTSYYSAQNSGNVSKSSGTQFVNHLKDDSSGINTTKIGIPFGVDVFYKDTSGNIIELNKTFVLDKDSIQNHTSIELDSDNNISAPVVPNFYFPSTNKVQTLLDGLENSTGDETGTQNAVDTFVDSLGQTETETDPDTGGEGGTVTDPDTGGQGGTGGGSDGGEDTEENDMFLADLKNVFPFCIPFDLVDCFRLFNAEPETPRVEVPLHFGIVDKDYTFVIDLKDFDGVAEICRTMFLILFIVGLVMATRPLIRG